jgi:hypothetical protein
MTRTAIFMAAALCAAAAVAGCERQQTPPAATASSAPTAKIAPPLSVNEMMVMIVDRPGELLWDSEKEGRGPRTAEDWYLLQNHAVDLAAAATLIRLGGTGPNDAAWAQDPNWQKSSVQLTDAALKARRAAEAKDLGALAAANGEIVDACEACHKQFKPDIPTGGLFMHQRPPSVPARS